MTLAISLAFWWIWQTQNEWVSDAEPTGMHHLGTAHKTLRNISFLHDFLNSWTPLNWQVANTFVCAPFHCLFLHWQIPFCQGNFLKIGHPHKKLQHFQQCLSPVLCPFSWLSLVLILFLSLIPLIFLQWNYPQWKNLQFL